MSEHTDETRGLGPVAISGASGGPSTMAEKWASRGDVNSLRTEVANLHTFVAGKARDLNGQVEELRADALVQQRKLLVLSVWTWFFGITAFIGAGFSSVSLWLLLN